MRNILGVILLAFPMMLWAQQPSVVYNYSNNWFNQGSTIPSETHFDLIGQIPMDVSKVSIDIKKSGKKDVLYSTEWSRSGGDNGGSFSIPIKQNLRSNKAYDFTLNFYRLTSKGDKKNIQSQLYTAIDGYIDGKVEVSKRKVQFSSGSDLMISELKDIVRQSLTYYEPVTGFEFPGFSDIIRNKIDAVNDTKLSKSKTNVGKKANKAETRKAYSQKLINELKDLLHNEVSPYVLQDAYVLSEKRIVTDVKTNKSVNYLTLQAGYGAIYMDGSVKKDESYERGFYAGVVLPFGKPAFVPKFIRNASLSAGVFLKNFTDDNGETITGPIVNRPIYLGLGYTLFDFIKFNAGGVLLQNRSTKGFEIDFSNLRVRPYVGVSAQIKLSGKLDR